MFCASVVSHACRGDSEMRQVVCGNLRVVGFPQTPLGGGLVLRGGYYDAGGADHAVTDAVAGFHDRVDGLLLGLGVRLV